MGHWSLIISPFVKKEKLKTNTKKDRRPVNMLMWCRDEELIERTWSDGRLMCGLDMFIDITSDLTFPIRDK